MCRSSVPDMRCGTARTTRTTLRDWRLLRSWCVYPDRIIAMSKLRRLRRLVPDEALFDRRVAGESLRAIAPDYEVEHTTLGDFFGRPDGVLGLKEARRRLQAARKARQAAERELKQAVRKRAHEDKQHDRRLA